MSDDRQQIRENFDKFYEHHQEQIDLQLRKFRPSGFSTEDVIDSYKGFACEVYDVISQCADIKGVADSPVFSFQGLEMRAMSAKIVMPKLKTLQLLEAITGGEDYPALVDTAASNILSVLEKYIREDAYIWFYHPLVPSGRLVGGQIGFRTRFAAKTKDSF